MIKNDELPEEYNNIWSKVSISIKKGFDSVPVYHEKCLKQNIKVKSTQMFERRFTSYLSIVMLIDSVSKIGKKYYPHVFRRM